MEYALTTSALTKTYGHARALDGVDMHVPKGAIYGFVGKNGAGKTTLIRIICGLQAPTSGFYTLLGTKSSSKQIYAERARMGAVVEAPAVYEELTAEENLKEQNRVLGLPSDSGIGETLELVGLAHTGKKRAKRFSLGMKQRLGIAIALAGHPDFLVLDEPANGLDPEGIVEIRELVLRLSKERGVTFLISSHILDELARIATTFGFIEDGRMVREISAEDLERACRQSILLRVSDTKALARTLDAKGLEYHVLSDCEAEVLGSPQVTDLVLALKENGCIVETMTQTGQTLESYYMNLIGGGRHA